MALIPKKSSHATIKVHHQTQVVVLLHPRYTQKTTHIHREYDAVTSGRASPRYENTLPWTTLRDISLLCLSQQTLTHPQSQRDFIPRAPHTFKRRHLRRPKEVGYPLPRKKKRRRKKAKKVTKRRKYPSRK
ncbi:hypothetical protein AMTR_s00139p00051960 [Amborella trichopoda]|uniref:Uncharacterized protein n=1 Tax=Amborella trichopoda TaxID=13333 RepID=W1NDR9_AMBTC|nr:hypothetical protein AMTR_s00139p00051960 [Amborella trichopoda]